jgi:hypothetical protein
VVRGKWKPHYEWKYDRVVLTKIQDANLRFRSDTRYIFLTDIGWVGLDDLFSFLELGFKRNTGVPFAI